MIGVSLGGSLKRNIGKMVAELKITLKDDEGTDLTKKSLEYDAFCMDMLDPIIKDRFDSALAEYKGNKEDFRYAISSKILVDRPRKSKKK